MGSSREQHQVRTVARRKALQILFQSEITGQDFESILAEDFCIDVVGVPCDYTRLLLGGVQTNSEVLDELIAKTSENWSLERMPLVDRSILRLAIFEMLHVDEVPYSVSINEAVELAKRFGGEDESPRFVNGILGRIASELAEGVGEGTVSTKAKSRREKKALHG
jgi:N utilization substance protein B